MVQKKKTILCSSGLMSNNFNKTILKVDTLRNINSFLTNATLCIQIRGIIGCSTGSLFGFHVWVAQSLCYVTPEGHVT